MQTNLKLFGWLFLCSAFVAVFRLRYAGIGMLLLIGPAFALFQIAWLQNILSSKPRDSRFFKVPGLAHLRDLLDRSIALPRWIKLCILLACLFGGLGLSRLFLLLNEA